MISDLNGSLGPGQLPYVCTFKSSGLITHLECTSDYKVTYVFVAFERN